MKSGVCNKSLLLFSDVLKSLFEIDPRGAFYCQGHMAGAIEKNEEENEDFATEMKKVAAAQ